MESSYGIGVKNRYAVFIGDEEEDPLEIVTKTTTDLKPKTSVDKASNRVKALNDSKLTNVNHQTIIKDKTKDSIIKPKTSDGLQTTAKSKDIGPKGESNRNSRPKTDRIQRNPTQDKPNHVSDRQNRPPRPLNDQKDIDDVKNQRNKDERFGGNNEVRERRDHNERRSESDRRGGRNGRSNGSRRGGGRFGDERRGKRDLDRHSGSDKAGVKATDKREGGGAHNWGKIGDFGTNEEPFTADHQELTDRSADETALEVNDTNQENDVNPNEEPKELEPKEMTLQEYKQQLEEQRVQPKFNLRKPGEGEDSSQWKKTFILKKKEEEEEVEYEEIEVEEEIRKGRHKQLLDIEINFRDEGRDFPRRGGDGRRGGRGGRERGDRDRGDRERGDRDRGDRERGDRERGDRERGDRERGDRERGVERGDRDRGERSERPGERTERRDRGGDRDGNRGADRGGNRGARSDRPFGRSDRPRRGRDGGAQTAPPKVNDASEFPSLLGV